MQIAHLLSNQKCQDNFCAIRTYDWTIFEASQSNACFFDEILIVFFGSLGNNLADTVDQLFLQIILLTFLQFLIVILLIVCELLKQSQYRFIPPSINVDLEFSRVRFIAIISCGKDFPSFTKHFHGISDQVETQNMEWLELIYLAVFVPKVTEKAVHMELLSV